MNISSVRTISIHQPKSWSKLHQLGCLLILCGVGCGSSTSTGTDSGGLRDGGATPTDAAALVDAMEPSDSGSPDGGAGPDSGCPTTPLFADVHSRTFSACNCHMRASPPPSGMLDLSPGVAYQNLVNVPAVRNAMKMRVTPGDPDASFLWQKLNNLQDPASEGGPMPRPMAGMPWVRLPDAELNILRCWIAGGAPND